MWNKIQPVFGTFRTDRQSVAVEPDSPPRPTCSIILAALNEEQSLPGLVGRIEAVLTNYSYEVVLVDDGSIDRTWQIMQQALRRHPNWQAVRLTRPFGHKAALWAGLTTARGAATIVMNSDGRHPTEMIPKMIACWRGGARVVEMVRRRERAGSPLMDLASRTLDRILAGIGVPRIRRADEDFRLLDRSIVDLILQSRGPVPALCELVPWLGCRTAEMPYDPFPAVGRKSTRRIQSNAALGASGKNAPSLPDSLRPLRRWVCTGLFVSMIAISFLTYLACSALFTSASTPGWAVAAALVALLGGIHLACLGLISSQLARLSEASWDRPPYVIRQVSAPPPPLQGRVPAPVPSIPARAESGAEFPIGNRIDSPVVMSS